MPLISDGAGIVIVPEDGTSVVSEPDAPSSDTTSLPADAEDYLEICGRLFPNPERGGWSWCAVDEEFRVWSETDLVTQESRRGFCLYRAPVSEPTSVLDLKALFGYWADQVALVHESADVVGIDIAPVQFAAQPNCRFEFDNCNLEWNRRRGSFDLIYGHKLLGNVNDRVGLLQNAFDCLAAGGFVELCDRPFHYTSKAGKTESWDFVARQAQELGGMVGCSFVVTPGGYTNDMIAAGFLDVCEEWETIPLEECLDSVLDEVKCFLLRKWHMEGIPREKISTRIADLSDKLVSEASNIDVK
ncbi:Trans-aconitate 2-methyltransferase (Fragment) [Madurella fahalii]|uniref:Trans-aconitate 2-methyltransferase n=1 Tax=Madurella fahalii TaxID=1157608 RepID=A0ABQ0G1M8_9PEZI